jgi:hypothetical protein
MTCKVLALVAEDPDGGYRVIDSRSGWDLAWRGELSSANEVAVYLNSTYPVAAQAPAHDSLVHEIVCWRIGGDVLPLEAVIDGGDLRATCPATVPFGPGWDHLYPEHEPPGPDWYRRAA